MPGSSEHLRAGLLSYGLFAGGALLLRAAERVVPASGLEYLLPTGPDVAQTALAIGLGFLVAGMAALFPDVDIKSRGQVLFYRLLAVADAVLLILFYTRQNLRFLEGAAFLGLVALLPLIGKHRGWTHSRVAMLAVPALFFLVPAALRGEPVVDGAPYFVAAVIGYGSHLYKDGRLLRR